MIDHVTLHVNDIEEGKRFYAAALKPLGYVIINEMPEWKLASFGVAGKPTVWVFAGEGAKQVAHIAFAAKNTQAVQAFYKAAMKAGGKDNGKAGYRTNYSAGYYAAFVIDPSGNNIEAVFHDKAKEKAAAAAAKKAAAKAKAKSKPKAKTVAKSAKKK